MSRSKQKGTTYETELVRQFQSEGWDAVRAWGSDGRAIGEKHDVDLVVSGPTRWKIQAKRPAELPKWITKPLQCARQLYIRIPGTSLVLVPLVDVFAKSDSSVQTFVERPLLPKWLQLGNCDLVCTREDYGKSHVLMLASTWRGWLDE